MGTLIDSPFGKQRADAQDKTRYLFRRKNQLRIYKVYFSSHLDLDRYLSTSVRVEYINRIVLSISTCAAYSHRYVLTPVYFHVYYNGCLFDRTFKNLK